MRDKNNNRERVSDLNYINIRVYYISYYIIIDIELD